LKLRVLISIKVKMGNTNSDAYIQLEKAVQNNDIKTILYLYRLYGHQVTCQDIGRLELRRILFNFEGRRLLRRKLFNSKLPRISAWLLCLFELYISPETVRKIYNERKITLKSLILAVNNNGFAGRKDLIRCMVELGVPADTIDWDLIEWKIQFNGYRRFKEEMYAISDARKLKLRFAIVLGNHDDHPLMQRRDMFYALCQVAGV